MYFSPGEVKKTLRTKIVSYTLLSSQHMLHSLARRWTLQVNWWQTEYLMPACCKLKGPLNRWQDQSSSLYLGATFFPCFICLSALKTVRRVNANTSLPLPLAILLTGHSRFNPASFCPRRKFCLLIVWKIQNETFTKPAFIFACFLVKSVGCAIHFSPGCSPQRPDLFWASKKCGDHKGIRTLVAKKSIHSNMVPQSLAPWTAQMPVSGCVSPNQWPRLYFPPRREVNACWTDWKN